MPRRDDAPIPYVITEDGRAAVAAWFGCAKDAEAVGAALAKASELEQAIRACLADPGIVRGFLQAERPELLKRLADALEMDPASVAKPARNHAPLGEYQGP